jgi:hypothetical protein
VPEGADELAGLERRRKELYRELGRVGDFRRGSLNEVRRKCASRAARAPRRIIPVTGRTGTQLVLVVLTDVGHAWKRMTRLNL